ncbi:MULTISPECIES: hypothetical protein [Vibrio]|uniref:hypothetical protein n=1 Tax=Vibrio TaxID=662 RepID=UPI0015586D9D|nr:MULTISPECIES: hypothetical protein [Vibrio]EGQ8449038.1 hypothetical protein [Vibrio alginolyticus]EJN3357949.1 hypothetical protein [Vibrio alginolyticus]ELA6661679.1 hypothetical protein [Vibrio alginolyticus]ELB1514045.1 hypothetical protein [Vibrio alginolyticus]ELI1833468.1 hypothetical protein [Vibrio alginolyticus]
MSVLSQVQVLKKILLGAAKSKRTVSYPEIYDMFDQDTEQSVVWDTFEKACTELANPQVAIYGALLAQKSTKLPHNGFFDVFMNTRYEEFLHITNNDVESSNAIPRDMQLKIVMKERERVYEHAASL